MRRILLFLLILSSCLFCRQHLSAQTGWLWGKSSTSIGSGAFDLYHSASDRGGNTFFDGIFDGDSIKLGTAVVLNTGVTSDYQQFVIAKVDPAGNYKWAIGSSGPAFSSTFPMKMITDPDGNVYEFLSFDGSRCTIGSYSFTNANSPLSNDAFLIKISPEGNILWAKNIGQVGNGGLGMDSTEDLYISGSFTLPALTVDGITLTNRDVTGANSDIFVMRMSPSGVAKWGKSFGSAANDDVIDMSVSKSGNVYLFARNYFDSLISIDGTLTIDSVYYFVKYDNSGHALLVKEYGKQDVHPTNITVSTSGSIYACGYDQSYNLAMIKYAPDGSILSKQTMPQTDGSGKISYSIALDLCGNLWTCGSMATSNYSTPSPHGISFPGYTLNSPAGSYDPMYIARYDTICNYVSSMAVASGGEDWNSITLDNKGNFIIAGDYVKNGKVGFGNDTLYTTTIMEDLFIAKYRYDNIDCDHYVEVDNVANTPEEVTIFPNPAANECTISSAAAFSTGAKAALYDMTGRMVYTAALHGNTTTISLAHITPGIYQCRVSAGDGKTTVKRLVVMQ